MADLSNHLLLTFELTEVKHWLILLIAGCFLNQTLGSYVRFVVFVIVCFPLLPLSFPWHNKSFEFF